MKNLTIKIKDIIFKMLKFLFIIIKKTLWIYIIIIIIMLIFWKTWYLSNIILSTKYLSINYNINIKKDIEKRLNLIGFKDTLLKQESKDYTFTSFYVLWIDATMGTYNPMLNTLFITNTKDQYNWKVIKKEIENWKHDDTIAHEMIHYFLNQDKVFKDKVFKLQSEILKRDKKIILKNFHNNNFLPWTKEWKKTRFWPFSNAFAVLSTPNYNPNNYSIEYIIKNFDNYKNDKTLEIIREEFLTFYFTYLFRYNPKLYKNTLIEDKLFYSLYKMFFKEIK